MALRSSRSLMSSALISGMEVGMGWRSDSEKGAEAPRLIIGP